MEGKWVMWDKVLRLDGSNIIYGIKYRNLKTRNEESDPI